MGRVGVAPTVFLMCLIYSQVPSLLGIPAHDLAAKLLDERCRPMSARASTAAAVRLIAQKTACVDFLQTDGS